ncbi:MAG: Rrf2 family transcriptional regulator, partial [Candidatus Dadabacteria bacterium]
MGLAVSTPAQYAVRALVYLARRNAAEAARVRDVAAAENIPYPFLAKLVGQLVQAGFLDSFKGPT